MMGAPLPGRRSLLAACMPLLPAATPTDRSDAVLLTLAAELREADRRHEAATIAFSRAEGSPTAEAARKAMDAASDACDALLLRMSETPASGLAGLAVKAALIVRATEWSGLTEAENGLADSLAADIARLVPQAVAA
ncbi:MAG: hypothetical protein DI601_08100 [Azospirillum brasilense]|nr:MAG: hypothetical protein DI601_08100 [Azospirillum brasilense]